MTQAITQAAVEATIAAIISAIEAENLVNNATQHIQCLGQAARH